MRSPLTAKELAECLTPGEFAAIHRTSPETIRRYCRQGRYERAVNIGTKTRPQWRIHPRELGHPVAEIADTTAA